MINAGNAHTTDAVHANTSCRGLYELCLAVKQAGVDWSLAGGTMAVDAEGAGLCLADWCCVLRALCGLEAAVRSAKYG